MPADAPAACDPALSGARLTGLYARTLVWYLIGVLVLWLAGLEGIYGHPTPFYALPIPAFRTGVVPFGMGALIAFACLLPGWPSAQRTTRRVMAGSFAGLLFAALAVAALYQEARTQNQSLQALAREYGLLFRWHLAVLLVFVAGLAVCLRVLRLLDWLKQPPERRATAWFLAGLVGFAILFACTVAMIRGGPAGIAQAYERQAYEYIGDIGAARTVHDLFARYVRLREYLSMHARVHPPGPIALLWLLSYLVGREPMALSLATIAVGASAIVPLYFWARELTDKRTALTACLLFSVVPSIVLFTATSADMLFAPFTLTTLFLFTRAIQRGDARYAVLAGLGFGVMSVLSFSLLGIGAYFALAGLWLLRSRPGTVVTTAAVMAAAFLAFHAAVWLWSGFDMVACFQACKAQFDLDQRHLDLVTPRWPAWSWRILNPLCWFFFAGIPVSVLFIKRLRRPDPACRGPFLVFLITLVALDVLYLARGEGERSALYVFPFLVIPAAHLLEEWGRKAASLAPLAATLAFLGFQCWLVESYLYTYW
ncbi:MAG: glycosyltransferase family 39 protein [Candidatus Hydrogenedentes bacterium]|nr:glycosyltransferase family 39 protein [Candidatus Hydrogenedentota bacterium]